jgi:hypothetical protein
MTPAERGLCPCDPRIYRFPASPVLFLSREMGRPTSLRVGPGIGARVASLRCPVFRPVPIILFHNLSVFQKPSCRITCRWV